MTKVNDSISVDAGAMSEKCHTSIPFTWMSLYLGARLKQEKIGVCCGKGEMI